MPRNMHNPLPASLHSECLKARQILESFIDGSFTGSPGKEMPTRFLGEAKGLAIITVIRAGFLGSARVGSGILTARLEDGSWSAPSAVATAGVGFGGQFGIELTDFVFILNERALRTFSRTGSLTLSGNISIAFGPFGRSAEVSGGASTNGLASMFSYSKTVGMYGGVTVEGGMLIERKSANRKFYKTKVTADQLLRGEVPLPDATQSLMRVLGHKVFDPPAEMESREVPVTREISQPDGVVELSARAEAQPPSELPVDSGRGDLSPTPSPRHGNVRDLGIVTELDGTPCTPQPAELSSEPVVLSSVAGLPASVSEKPSRKPLRQDSGQSPGAQDAEPTVQPSPESTSPAEPTEKAAASNNGPHEERPAAFTINA
ncbi:DUF500-domain-containing protein [Aspergillus steynii IBT 23096]|uniref:DUF500-domain-containing protein n=1 Tax=Aspergillus steynii IBT 23096 TaxID=1392250 RepID=A0A2I2FWG9_9EURO|nr:DUF500-domain-containing protein [Aspergillus steynii IBT 23096]PLB44993.1 DUF500-domain-containing protein [Aspergillus steynii IBT 23096]